MTTETLIKLLEEMSDERLQKELELAQRDADGGTAEDASYLKRVEYEIYFRSQRS